MKFPFFIFYFLWRYVTLLDFYFSLAACYIIRSNHKLRNRSKHACLANFFFCVARLTVGEDVFTTISTYCFIKCNGIIDMFLTFAARCYFFLCNNAQDTG